MEEIKNKIKANKKVILLITCILSFVIVIQISLAKYVIEIKDTHIQESPAFYFESNIANVDTAKQYIINKWDGKTSKEIKFDITNYLNKLLNTEQEIKYKIDIAVIDLNSEDGIDDSTLVTLELKDSNNTIIANNQELTMTGNVLTKNNYILNIIPNNIIENGKKLKIKTTITSTSPYEKELIGEIDITTNRIEDYEVNLKESNNNEYVTLNIKVNDPNNDITIKYDNTKTIVDKSTSILNNIDITEGITINSFIIPKEKLEKWKIYEIDFVKNAQDIVLGTDIIFE